MKKRNYLLAIAAVFVAILVVPSLFISCSDDEDITISFDELVAQSGIIAEVQGGIYNFEVKSNGKWSAFLPEDCNWANLCEDSGDGNGWIKIGMDCNFTGIPRSTTITISTEDETKTISLKQNETIEGLIWDENDSENSSAKAQQVLTYNLSTGVNAVGLLEDTLYTRDPDTYLKNSQVLRIPALKDYIEQHPEDQHMLVIETGTKATHEDATLDSLFSRKSFLEIGLGINVSYATFSVAIKGKYVGKDISSGSLIEYHSGAKYTLSNAKFSPASIAFLDEKAKKAIFTGDFYKVSKALKELCNQEQTRTAAVDSKIKRLIGSYGSGVIVKSRYGGLYALAVQADSAYVYHEMRIDSAKLEVNVKSALNVNVEVTGEYRKNAKQIIKHSRHIACIAGGDLPKSGAIVNALQEIALSPDTDDPGDVDDPNKDTDINTRADDESSDDAMVNLNKKLEDWVTSIAGSNATMLDYEVVPIYEFFYDDDLTAEMIRSYMEEHYKGTQFMKKLEYDY